MLIIELKNDAIFFYFCIIKKLLCSFIENPLVSAELKFQSSVCNSSKNVSGSIEKITQNFMWTFIMIIFIIQYYETQVPFVRTSSKLM